MNYIEKIKLEIKTNFDTINNLVVENASLQEKINKLESENWSPDKGDFIIETTGKIFNKLDSDFCREFSSNIQDLETDFGSVRTTQKRAEMAAENMRRFNRLSCFMGDVRPILEHSPISVALVFYDYDMEKIEKLVKILDINGKL